MVRQSQSDLFITLENDTISSIKIQSQKKTYESVGVDNVRCASLVVCWWEKYVGVESGQLITRARESAR